MEFICFFVLFCCFKDKTIEEISEGLVIDVGSVYENKIKLRVENQVVATGELVILNDRYGVRIDSVKKSKETPKVEKKAEKEEKPEKPAPVPRTPAASRAARRPVKAEAPKVEKTEENFDYSDFEIEDESI